MTGIRKLDPTLVNKIAAGEVIERPASVVKELVENAIDAAATRIDVAIEEGGSRLIRVADNGRGIARDDLPLAVAPHATSKIYAQDDLFNIRSLGFRGEALASIASVSHLTIRTRPAEQLEACELQCTDGLAQPVRSSASPVGTTVEIRNLFYNVPARRKFLRSPQTECSHVTEQIARLSLAHPRIAFTLSHNGRSNRNLPPTDNRKERIADFYGAELAEGLLHADREERGTRIEALFAPPDRSRASSKWQYLFLNGRYISDRRIAYAVREAFRGLVEHDRFPVVFIFLTVDPSQFDVNVHPTKIEVRWRDAGLIQSQVLAILRETLLSHDLTPVLRTSARAEATSPPGTPLHQERARQALADYLKAVDPTQGRIVFEPPRFPTRNVRPSITSTFDPPRGQHWPTERSAADPDGDAPASPIAASDATDAISKSPEATGDPVDAEPPDPYRSVLQIHNAYLVAQTEEGIIIVDQHALHERILYERFRERILAGPLESQRLLMPHSLEASPEQAQAAEQHQALLERLGIEVSAFGPQTLAVQSFPTLLPNVDIVKFVTDLLDKLAESDGAESEETHLHAALDMMACKAAVKAGDPLTSEEMEALLAQRHLVERSSNCPHGRPTTLQLSTADLDRQFKRV
ncbi:MAG: DNA mismatch repair endonuclease MutL [Planctomycetota bacterium]